LGSYWLMHFSEGRVGLPPSPAVRRGALLVRSRESDPQTTVRVLHWLFGSRRWGWIG